MALALLLAGLALANLLAAGFFAFDKLQAEARGQRIPEATLLLWSVAGGLGAKWAQGYFRHKTRKHPFARNLNIALGLHVVLALGLIGLVVVRS